MSAIYTFDLYDEYYSGSIEKDFGSIHSTYEACKAMKSILKDSTVMRDILNFTLLDFDDAFEQLVEFCDIRCLYSDPIYECKIFLAHKKGH